MMVVASLCYSSLAGAQSMEPRAYSSVPVGMNFLFLGYAYQHGQVLLDESFPLKDVTITANTAILGYSRSLNVFGRSGMVQMVVPYGWLSGSGTLNEDTRNREVSGLVDPAMKFSVNLFGAPALSMEQFKNYRQDTIIGLSLLVSMPFGQYDSSRLVNIGTNRWSFKPELGISKALGRWTLESIAGVTFFTINNNFFGGQTLEQAPIYSFQGHLIYNFQSGIWAALNATYYTGGRTTVNGVEGDNLQSNWRMGATLAFPLNRNQSIKCYVSRGVQTRTGGDFDLLGILWQYRWGGGL